MIRAWGNPVGEKLESWGVQDGFVETKEALERIASGRYMDSSGIEYIISLTLVDAMGHRTKEVYDWCRGKVQIKPSKGEQRMSTPYAVTKLDHYPGSNMPIPGGLPLYRLNSGYYKDELFNKLSIAPTDPGAFHMHSGISDDYVSQMIAEFRNDQGIWECPPGRPNHYWDCEYLAFAAADILRIQHWAASQATEEKDDTQPRPAQQKRRRLW